MVKKKSFLVLALCLFAALTYYLPPQAAMAQGISAKITSIDGDVTVKADEKAEWQPAKAGQDLSQGAYVMTAFESNCELEFTDKSKVKVKELSKIQINKFTNELKKVDTQVTLYNGKVRATVHKDVDKNTNFQVKTPVSTISVRGTEKEIAVQPGFGTSVQTISGVVEVSNNIGQKITIKKDESTQVQQQSSQPTPITEVAATGSRIDVTGQSLQDDEKKFVQSFTESRTQVDTTKELVKEALEETKQEYGRLTVTWK